MAIDGRQQHHTCFRKWTSHRLYPTQKQRGILRDSRKCRKQGRSGTPRACPLCRAHTIFKGTRRRRAWHILNRMELVGGELNAYTTKEETLVYSVFPAGNMERAVELIADLVQNSIFPEKELEKEREVVLEEIHSYRDTPSESIYDDFEDLVFAGHPLGHNILGSEKSLSRIGQTECRRYLTELLCACQHGAFRRWENLARTNDKTCRTLFCRHAPQARTTATHSGMHSLAVLRNTQHQKPSSPLHHRCAHIRNARQPQICIAAAQQHARRPRHELRAQRGHTRTPWLCLHRGSSNHIVHRLRAFHRVFRLRCPPNRKMPAACRQ